MSRLLALLAVATVSCIRPNPLFIEDGLPAGESSSDDPGEVPATGTDVLTGTTHAATTDPTEGAACDTDCQDPGPACLAPPCPGDLDWLIRAGDGANQRARDVALLADGSVIVVGEFTGTLGSGDHTITATTDPTAGDAFVLRLDPAGQLQWLRQFGGDGLQQIVAVAILPDDVIAVTGRFTDELVTDSHTIPPIGSAPGFVAALAPADGATFTVHLIGGDDVSPQDIAAGPDGDVLVAGGFYGDILFPKKKYSGDGLDLFAARLDLNSGPQWILTAIAPDDQLARAIARGPGDTTILAGELHGQLPLGLDTLLAAGRDGFLARLDANGIPQSTVRFGGPGDDRMHTLAVAPDGAVVIAGAHDGGLDLGAGVLPHTPGALDGFIAAFDPKGALRWTQAGFVLAGDALAIARADDGTVIAALPVGDTIIALGDTPLTGAPGLLLVAFAEDGPLLWARRLEGAIAPGFGLAAGASRVAVAGAFDSTLSHGDNNLQSAGQLDVFAGLFRLP